MLRGTGDDVLSCGHLESLTGSLQVPPHPRYSRSAAPGIGISSQSPSFRFLCLAEMSMLFCSWANKDEEEPDDDQDVDDEDQEGESKEEEKEEVKENTETVSEKGEKSEDSKDDGASVSEKPAPAFFCKWATEEEEYKSESDQEEEEEEEAANEEEVGEPVVEDEAEVEEEKADDPPPEPVKEDKPVIFCKWGDHEEYESSEDEEPEEVEDKKLEDEAKLEPESEEEDKTFDNAATGADENGGWMVRMVEDATNDLLNLPLAPDTASDAQDPFDSVFSSSRSSRTIERKTSRTTNNYGSDSDGDNYIPEVETGNFEVIDGWDDYVADTIEGNEKEEREAKEKRTTRANAGRKPGPKSMKPGPKSMKTGPKLKAGPKSQGAPLKSTRPGPASRRGRRRSSSEGSAHNLDLSNIRLNKRNDVTVTAAERQLANKHMMAEKNDDDEEEDVPLARRRRSGGSRKRKGEGEETKRSKKARTETGENRRSSRDSELGWPRLSSVFDSGEDGRRVRKPTAKVQPFVHVEPEKEKRRVRPKDRGRAGGAPTKKRIHQPAKGPYFTACKIGSYRCPLCLTEWKLNQPYGRHIIAQACQVRG